jgi:hypothetical protein
MPEAATYVPEAITSMPEAATSLMDVPASLSNVIADIQDTALPDVPTCLLAVSASFPHTPTSLSTAPASITNINDITTIYPSPINNEVSYTAENPGSTPDGSDALDLDDNADLDTSDLALDLNEILLGNNAPSLDHFVLPTLTANQTAQSTGM